MLSGRAPYARAPEKRAIENCAISAYLAFVYRSSVVSYKSYLGYTRTPNAAIAFKDRLL